MEETGTDGGLPTGALFFHEVRPEDSSLNSRKPLCKPFWTLKHARRKNLTIMLFVLSIETLIYEVLVYELKSFNQKMTFYCFDFLKK